MDAFEQLVGEILRMKGFWVHTSVKVGLTKEEKRLIGRYSAPRWELDVVGYRGSDNVLQIVECKSYLDSIGVQAASFVEAELGHGGRYKLFNEKPVREVVCKRLVAQLVESGACAATPKVQLALACGKFKSNHDRQSVSEYFNKNGWELWDDTWLRDSLRSMANMGYQNQMSAVVAKLLLRGTLE
ncbi:hypothetical protein [Nitrospirillum iridis]|uniref:Restriction endonuclease type IV Mrr domain-containing protein n=1 Tax=Nitrospirillum iridis TaxID=765888 RepID=A0A7X0AU23_9PROT|nr:hypothetical protein [Nitrospirillum iridis]MBB6250114.1 hypothetical protein [Nitrospirillum iridis]